MFYKVCNIDLNMKWYDYTYHELYLWSANKKTIFKISEGTGVNLLAEDIAEGYKDYWMTEYIVTDGYCDGGQWMETEFISDLDYTIQGVLNRMMECDLWEDEWEILDHNFGEELFDEMERSL